jgi:hypothetical protein
MIPYFRSAGIWVVLVGLEGGLSGPAHGTAECLICHNNPKFILREGSGRVRSLFVDPQRFYRSVHGSLDCVDCHTNFSPDPHAGAFLPQGPNIPNQEFLARSTHRNKAAVLACMNCHPREFQAYRRSVHGEAVARGEGDAPRCMDCHGDHYIPPVASPESAVRDINVPATCAKCHTNALIMARHDVRTQTVETFEASFHGKKLALGSENAADCTSCHGVHDIYRPDDPRSSVYPANRPQTCGRCHAGADETFAQGFTHVLPSQEKEALVYWVGRLYVLFIYVTIGGMGLYILLDLGRRILNWLEPQAEE